MRTQSTKLFSSSVGKPSAQSVKLASETECSQIHLVEKDQTQVMLNPPSFVTLVREPNPPGLHAKDLRFYTGKASLCFGVFMCVL